MIPTAVFTPVSATLPASRTAVVSGSLPPDCCCGGRGCCCRSRCCRGGVVCPEVRAAVRVLVERFARWAVLFARVCVLAFGVDGFDAAARDERALDPLARLSLRRPGRDRGRLPRTPGSSLSSAATDGNGTARGGGARRHFGATVGNPLHARRILG
jgi:hypothetical protein